MLLRSLEGFERAGTEGGGVGIEHGLLSGVGGKVARFFDGESYFSELLSMVAVEEVQSSTSFWVRFWIRDWE